MIGIKPESGAAPDTAAIRHAAAIAMNRSDPAGRRPAPRVQLARRSGVRLRAALAFAAAWALATGALVAAGIDEATPQRTGSAHTHAFGAASR